MRIEKDKCNNCGKETTDRYLELGWIHIGVSGNHTIRFAFSFSLGRAENGSAQTAYFSEKILDFCCMACLVKFFDKGVQERKQQLEEE